MTWFGLPLAYPLPPFWGWVTNDLILIDFGLPLAYPLPPFWGWVTNDLILIQRPRQRSPPLQPLRRLSCLRVLYILRDSWPFSRAKKTVFLAALMLDYGFILQFRALRSECRRPHAKIRLGSIFVGLWKSAISSRLYKHTQPARRLSGKWQYG